MLQDIWWWKCCLSWQWFWKTFQVQSHFWIKALSFYNKNEGGVKFHSNITGLYRWTVISKMVHKTIIGYWKAIIWLGTETQIIKLKCRTDWNVIVMAITTKRFSQKD